MSKRYILILVVLTALAFGLLILPDSNRSSDVKPELLLKEINSSSRYLSVDIVAERLIDEDPSIMLIDVRSPYESAEYSLPNAFAIPLEEVVLPDWEDYLNQDDMDVVLYSNGDLFADQAWILCTRLGYKNLYVMKGGLNEWFKTIMQPVSPPETASKEEFDLYSFRKAARQYFGGGSNIEIEADLPKENIVIKKREKKVVAEGGC